MIALDRRTCEPRKALATHPFFEFRHEPVERAVLRASQRAVETQREAQDVELFVGATHGEQVGQLIGQTGNAIGTHRRGVVIDNAAPRLTPHEADDEQRKQHRQLGKRQLQPLGNRSHRASRSPSVEIFTRQLHHCVHLINAYILLRFAKFDKAECYRDTNEIRVSLNVAKCTSTLTNVASFEKIYVGALQGVMKRKDITPRNQTLGEYVRARRLSLGLSYQDVADASGLHYSYWNKLENGQYEQPAPKYLRIIADTLDVPIEDLLALAGYDLPERLPSFTPYLRAKYELPPEAIADLERYFDLLRNFYGIPKDQPVFPPKTKPTNTTKPAPKRDNERRAA